MRLHLRTALIVACLAPTVGCGAIKGDQVERGFAIDAPPATIASPAAAPAEAAAVGAGASATDVDAVASTTPAPSSSPDEFLATDLFAGSTVDGTALLDGASLVTFVTPDCNFAAQHADLLSTSLDGSDDVTQVIVHSGTNRDAATAWVAEMGLVGEHVVHLDDSDGDLTRRFGVTAFPTTVLVAADGGLSKTEGALDQDRLDAALAIVRS